ncbi:MAG: LSU ribosomal protein L29p (L35e), partial [uncultured Rubellimicrobium sp.]
ERQGSSRADARSAARPAGEPQERELQPALPASDRSARQHVADACRPSGSRPRHDDPQRKGGLGRARGL